MSCLSEASLARLAELIAQKRPGLLTADDRETLNLLRTAFGLTKGAVERFFRDLGEEDVPSEKLAEKFSQLVEEHKKLLAEAKAYSGDDPEVKALRDRAIPLIETGQYEAAKELLAKARDIDLSAIANLEAAADKRRLSAADAQAALGSIALLEFKYLDAAAAFGQAHAMTPVSHIDQKRSYLEAEADAYYRQGYEKGDNSALLQAIGLYRQLLNATSRETAPLDWAATQNNLGNALCALGERESGTARLEEAVAAYRAALEEWTRERVPLDWAMTQNNLGNALSSARASARAGRRGWRRRSPPIATALEEWTRERVPLDWAMTQNNLGNALRTLGRARERDGAAGGGGRRLSRRAGGTDARARAARLGDDAEQSRHRASDARGARERDGAAGGGGRRLSRRRCRNGRASACRSTGR